jgi:hypothetical protein
LSCIDGSAGGLGQLEHADDRQLDSAPVAAVVVQTPARLPTTITSPDATPGDGAVTVTTLPSMTKFFMASPSS